MEKRHRKMVLLAVVLIVVLVVICSGLLFLESAVFYPDSEAQNQSSSKTVTRNGINYFPRQDMTVILLMGIDESGPARDSLSYNNEGEADMVMLAVFDEKTEKCSFLVLNRDTMMEIPVLGLAGKQAGTKVAQLALSHTYGSGLEDSCENTKKTVSDFLHGVTIDYYVAMNMDAVAVLNDAVGGVTVNVQDDFSLVDPSIEKGSFTLHGEQALSFVRTRWYVGDSLNLTRMERQKEYMEKFVQALSGKMKEEEDFVLATYESVAPYLVSDLPVNSLGSFAERYENYTVGDILSVEGESVLGNEFYEFYPDEEKLEELVLKLFYAPK